MLGLALLHSWVFWAACALGFCLGIGLLGWHAKKPAMLPNKKPPQNIMGTSPGIIRSTIPRRLTDQAKGLPWISLVVVFLVGGAVWAPLGYLYRDHVLAKNSDSITRAEVFENKNRAQGWYGLRLIKSRKEFPVRFCPGTPEFPIGTVFDEIKYEDRGWCYSMASKKFGFVINMEETHVRTASR